MYIRHRMPSKLTPGSPGESATNWNQLAATPEFRNLVRQKRRFVLQATAFFVVYYFALPILVGYFPEMMNRKVWGQVNIAYLFALSQFVMAWVVAALYVMKAEKFDEMAADVTRRGQVR
jgi:uncharacterized membrane protein (DUF485 family)